MTGTGIATLSPDKQSVWWWNQGKWQRIADVTPRSRLFGGTGGLLAEYPDGDVYLFNARTNSFDHFGGPGADFVSTQSTAYALTPQGEAVWGRPIAGGDGTWSQVGGAAKTILAGGETLLTTDPQAGNLWAMNFNQGQFHQIGGPGSAFAIGNGRILALTPANDAVLSYDVLPLPSAQWTTIGAAATAVFVDGNDLGYAISPDGQTIFRWDGTAWTSIGPAGAFPMAGAQFAASVGLTALTADKQAVWACAAGTTWTQIGGPADSIVATNLVPPQ